MYPSMHLGQGVCVTEGSVWCVWQRGCDGVWQGVYTPRPEACNIPQTRGTPPQTIGSQMQVPVFSVIGGCFSYVSGLLSTMLHWVFTKHLGFTWLYTVFILALHTVLFWGLLIFEGCGCCGILGFSPCNSYVSIYFGWKSYLVWPHQWWCWSLSP